MSSKYNKIGVIGDKDSVLGFKALGIDVFACEKSGEAAKLVNRLAKKRYAVIFITEILAKDIDETLDRYKTKPFPTITMIPSNQGSKGIALQGVKDNVEKAIGVDILFSQDER